MNALGRDELAVLPEGLDDADDALLSPVRGPVCERELVACLPLGSRWIPADRVRRRRTSRAPARR